MRIPTLAVTLAAAATVVVLPTTANAAAPVATDDSAQVLFQSFKSINVASNDTDADAGQSLSYAVATEPTHGTVSCSAAGVCRYDPADGWTGTDTFNYTVTDSGTVPESDTGTVTVRTINVGLIGRDLSTRNLVWGDTLDITGFVKDPSGALLHNVDVKLMARGASGVYQQVGQALSTGNTGTMSVTGLAPTETTTYKWMVENKSSTPSQVTVTPKLLTSWSDKKLAVGDTSTLTVTTAPVTEGGSAVLERRMADGTWSTVATHAFTSTSTADQTFTFEVLADNGSRVYRVRLPESGNREEATSTTATVKGYKAAVVDFVAADADEWVKIENTGKVTFDIKDWVLSDNDSEVPLPSHKVRAGETVKVHSGSGRITLRNTYLKDAARYWEPDSTITLTDDNAHPVSTFPVAP